MPGAGGREAAQAGPRPAFGQAQARARPGFDQARARPEAAARAVTAESELPASGAPAYTATEIEMTGRGNFDPLHNRWFQLQLLRQAGMFAALALLGFFITFIIFALTGAGSGNFTGAFSGWVQLDTYLTLLIGVLFWLIPVPALLAQSSKLTPHGADAADIVFRHVTAAFGRHRTPLDALREKSLNPPGEGRRSYLELRRGHFAAYISCFAHGRDLYVGWTYWLRMSPLRWMLMVIGRKFQELTGRGNDIYQTLRFESARATAAAMQSAVLEGTAEAAAELARQNQRPASQPGSAALELS